MSMSLPTAIAAYFDVSNGADDVHLTDSFAPDAVVRDESQAHHGPQAIRLWLREARRKYQQRVEPLRLTRDGARVTVTGKVSGNFPGSPLQLDHVFELRDDKIQSLEIH
jgi:hypothetical protein